MLIMFRAKNFTSFKDDVVLDLRKTSLTGHENHIIKDSDFNVLKTVAIYGANASGKSNFICAISAFINYIKSQLYDRDNNDRELDNTTIVPFLLTDNIEKSTEFEIVFKGHTNTFQFGFKIEEEQILSEWLLVNNDEVYSRDVNKIEHGKKYASLLKNHKKYREDRLFLSMLDYYSEHKRIKELLDEFKEFIENDIVVYSEWNVESGIKEFATELITGKNKIVDDKEVRDKVSSCISKIDVGITELEIEYETLTNRTTGEKKEFPMIKTKHEIYNQKGNKVGSTLFSLGQESSGTQAFIKYMENIISIVESGGVFVIDEFSNHLHPLLTKFIIDMFQLEGNKKSAQLIFTTHETTILNKDQFRRDEIVFVEKDEMGRSKLRTLSDFGIRKDASFSKDYLSGKYGAIPIFKDYIDCVNGDNNGKT